MKASASAGTTPDFCGSSPVLTLHQQPGAGAGGGDLVGDGASENAQPVKALDHVEEPHGFARLVGLQRPDEAQFDAEAALAPNARPPPAPGFRRETC